MPLRRPTDDPRRRYGTFLQLGLAGALGLSVAAFTVPYGPDSPEPFVSFPDDPIRIEAIPPTAMTPPPPPPPAPPPPVAVPDDVDVATVIDAVDLDLAETLPPPVEPITEAMPAPVIVPPTPPVVPPTLDRPTPPTPPVVEPEVERVFEVVEQQPELIGGLEALQGRVNYPRLARDAGIQGRVIVQFVVDERGRVTEPVVLRSPSDLLSVAALRAVEGSTFVPGVQSGRPVKVRYSLPVNFVLR